MKRLAVVAAWALAALALASCNTEKGTAPVTAAKLWFTTRPSVSTAGVPISPAVQVAILDVAGDTVTNASSSVTITLAKNPDGGTLSGTTTVNAIHGIATFTDLSLDKVSDAYTFAAASGSLLPDTTPAFSIRAASPARLAFTAPPNTSGATAVMPPVRVEIQDVFGNTATRAASPVTLTLDANPVGATLSGTTTVSAVNGVATFADLSIDKPGAGYTLSASSTALAAVTSPTFNIDAPPVPTKIGFTAIPSIATAGAPIFPAVRVAIEDATGATLRSAANVPVTVALATNSTGATLSGTLTVNAVGGVATFNDLSIDRSGNYTLTASSGALGNASSATFTVNPAPPQLHITTTTTGVSLPSTYTLNVDCDSYGCQYSGSIGVNDAATISVYGGDHFVQLLVPDNCVVTGDAARTVTVTGLTNVPFVVSCGALGTVNVLTTTTGIDANLDSYVACVDQSGNACFWHSVARANDAISIPRVLSGAHQLSLTGVGGNCTVAGGSSHSITLPADGVVSASFAITCVAAERIAFALNGSVSMIHSDATALHFVTTGAAPSWSPDGSKLAYECVADLCTVNADGTGIIRVTSGGAGNHHPTWSPDGLYIAFASTAGGTNDLYIVSATGGTPVRLTNNVGFAGSPAWSPDGTQIAFDCQVDVGNFDICTVHSDGTGLTRLTTDPARDYGAAWKPDGSALAFATARFGSDEIVLMSAGGGAVTRLAGGLPGFAPTWSPDGSQLAFVRLGNDPTTGPFQTLMVSHSDGSNVQALTRGGQPAWRPR